MKHIAIGLLLAISMSCAQAEDRVEDKEIPRIVLHDILTNRVCIYESKLYSIGAKLIILGQLNECINAAAMSFSSNEQSWDMKWQVVPEGNRKGY